MKPLYSLAIAAAMAVAAGGVEGASAPVDLGTAGNYAILAKSGISTVPPSAVTGDLGVSPIDSTAITGFSLLLDGSNQFSTSSQVTGKIYAADYSPPTPADLTTAVRDMETAYTDAAGRAADVTELGAGNIGGLTLVPNVYKWGTGVTIPTNVTLSGGRNDVWIFQIAEGLTQASATRINLSGGALPGNIFWQVFGPVDIGTTAHFEGVLLSQTSIAMRTGASINGRLLAQTAVTLDAGTITQPAPETPSYLDLVVSNGSDFSSGRQLIIGWTTRQRLFGFAGVPCDVYLAAAYNPPAEDTAVTVDQIVRSEALFIFDSKMRPVLFDPRKVMPAFSGVVFPGDSSSGTFAFTVPGGVAGRWVFAAALVRRDTGQFPAQPPVEISNGFTVH